jgi:hypothetical protein
MRTWAHKHLGRTTPDAPLSILECGSGNGTLLLSFLTSPEDTPEQHYKLTGIDYSAKAAVLAQGVEQARRETLAEEAESGELEEVLNVVPPVSWREGDLLRDHISEEWDLVLDKGTFDALCLSDEPVQEDAERRKPSAVYPERISRLVKAGGYFLITSCNFTEDEIKRRWTKEGLGGSTARRDMIGIWLTFRLDIPVRLTRDWTRTMTLGSADGSSSVPHPKFTFGGKQGTTVCTVAFQKTGPSPADSIRR